MRWLFLFFIYLFFFLGLCVCNFFIYLFIFSFTEIRERKLLRIWRALKWLRKNKKRFPFGVLRKPNLIRFVASVIWFFFFSIFEKRPNFLVAKFATKTKISFRLRSQGPSFTTNKSATQSPLKSMNAFELGTAKLVWLLLFLFFWCWDIF